MEEASKREVDEGAEAVGEGGDTEASELTKLVSSDCHVSPSTP